MSEGPLTGITVVDLTRVLAGPFCTMVMADLGARVVKVEIPPHGDDSRQFGPFVEGKSAYFMSLNRGKESIVLDLKSSDDRATFERLLERADILVENFRPGTMQKLGYDWDVLHARFPTLIYAAVSGFGHTGPYSSRPAYDVVVQAMGGIVSLTGHPDSPPTRVGTSVGDVTAGLFTTIGILGALVDRARTGRGMKVDVGMLDCQVAILENAIARYTATGEVPGPIGARHPSITPFDAFATADGHMVIAAGTDALFVRLCTILDRDDLASDPRFIGNESRCVHHQVLKDEIEAMTRTRNAARWLAELQAGGVPCGPINSVDKVVNDPQVLSRQMLVTVHDPVAGAVRMAGNPVKLSAFGDSPSRSPAPDLGADTTRILDELDGEDQE